MRPIKLLSGLSLLTLMSACNYAGSISYTDEQKLSATVTASPTPLPPLVWAAPEGASDGSVLREYN